MESDDWAFEDQLKSRSKEQLQMDLIKIEKILDVARESMAATADEKRLHHALETSHASDIVHGMIEGYVIVEYWVTKTGAVRDPVVIDAKPPGIFNRAAINAALKYKYKPKVINGEPVDVPGVKTRITFEMADG